MAVARMYRVKLAGLLKDREYWLKALQEAQAIEVDMPENDGVVLGQEEINALELERQMAEIDRHLGDLDKTIVFIDRYFPVKPTVVQQFAGVKTFLTETEFGELADARDEAARIVDQAAELSGKLAELSNREASVRSDLQNLLPWSELDLSEQDLKGTSLVRVVLGEVEARHFGEVQDAVAAASFGCELRRVSQDQRSVRLALFVLAEHVAELSLLLAPFGFTQVTLPPYGKLAADRIDSLQRQLKEIAAEQQSLMHSVEELSGKRLQLQAAYDYYYNERYKLSVASKFAAGSRTFYLEGWIRTKDTEVFSNKAEASGLPHYLEFREPVEGEEPPSFLENRPIITPFESLLQAFSNPQYNEVDPTAIMAPFFLLFFGFALGDAGYGILLGCLCLALLKFLPMTNSGKKLTLVFLAGSVATIVMGLGLGGFFGDIIPFKPLFGINPVEQPIQLLILSVVLGVVQSFVGLVIGGIMYSRTAGIIAALLRDGAYALFLLMAILMLAKDFIGLGAYGDIITYALIASVVLVIIGAMSERKGFKKLLGIPAALYKIYNSIGFFGDILSYSRLMALALGGSVMGSVVNQFVRQFAALPNSVLGYLLAAIVFVFGHLLNMALNLLSAYVHPSRLQYLEFFGKFFEGGGRPFSPLRKQYKFTNIISKREA
ncbi:MAG: V-type ATP synthase subunit I [Bacillota bacterium]|jgi:V/A-type H+-transporting ATPase subunit I